MSRPERLASLVAVAAAAAGCPSVEHIDPPEQTEVGLTLFAGFDADWEKYQEVVDAYVAVSQAFIDSGDDGCFSWDPLLLKDACSVDRCDADPSGWPSVGRSEVMEFPVEDVEAALLAYDWTEVFGNFDLYEVQDERSVDEEELATYLSGEKHYYNRDYIAQVDAGIGIFEYYTKLQFRRVDDYAGTGHPLVLIRSWIPEPANASTDDLTMTVSFNFEILAPLDGGRAIRTFVSWSDARLGDGDPEDIASVVCFGYKGGFDDIRGWIEDVLHQG